MAVSLILPTDMKYSTLLLLSALAFASNATFADTVTVDPLQRHQTFRGFGTCLVSYSAPLISLYQSENFQRIYTEEIGMNLLRVDVGPYVHPQVANAEDIHYQNFNFTSGGQQHATNARAQVFLDFAKAIHNINPDVKVLLTVWSFPDWMKTNNSHLNGGSIRTSHYKHAAALLTEYVKLYKAEGIPVLGISFANEPQFAQFYNSQVIDPEPYANMLAVLGEWLDAAGIDDVMIYGPEHMTGDTAMNSAYASAINNNERARKYLDAFASHGYTNGINTDPSSTAPALLWDRVIQPNGWEFWMTEAGTGGSSSFTHDNSIDQLAGMIHNHLASANASVFSPWQVTDTAASEHNLMVNANQTSKSRVMQHYARTILPGMRRLQTYDSGSIMPTVFMNQEDGDVGIVLLNATNAVKVVDISFPSFPDTAFTTRSNRSGNEWETLANTQMVDGALTVSVPAKGMISLSASGLDLSGVSSEEDFQVGDEAFIIQVPGYASQLTLPIVAPEDYEWTAALSGIRWSTFEGKSGASFTETGDGQIVINFAANGSLTSTRDVTLAVNSREYIIQQQPFSEEPQPDKSWWDAVTPDNSTQTRDTSLLDSSAPGIGWIHDVAWPYAFSYSLQSWVHFTVGEKDGFYAYRFDTNSWLWGSNAWGWYYDFNTGWHPFNATE